MPNTVTLPIQTTEMLAKIVHDMDLPAMSDIAAQLVATLSKEEVDLTYLRDLIARDPSLTASLLRWANSPIHGYARKINTLDGAITVLGISKIRACAIAFFITNTIHPPNGIDRDAFWKSCMQSAGYAMWIALAVGLNESEAWLTGMLVRLGELVIGQFDPTSPKAYELSPLPVRERWSQQRQKLVSMKVTWCPKWPNYGSFRMRWLKHCTNAPSPSNLWPFRRCPLCFTWH